MTTILALAIILVAVFTGYSLKKYYDRPYIVNFSLSLLLLLIVMMTLLLQPITTLGYLAIAICSTASIFQLVLGLKSRKGKPGAAA